MIRGGPVAQARREYKPGEGFSAGISDRRKTPPKGSRKVHFYPISNSGIVVIDSNLLFK